MGYAGIAPLGSVLTLPAATANALSLLRLPLAVAVILTFDHPVRYVFFAAAALTDWLDGFTARTAKGKTSAGAVLDPLCDKFFVLTIVLYSTVHEGLTTFALVSFFLRDAFTVIATGVLWLWGKAKSFRVESRWSGKVVTFLQFCALLLLLAHQWAVFSIMLGPLFLLSVVSVVDYGLAGWKQIRGW